MRCASPTVALVITAIAFLFFVPGIPAQGQQRSSATQAAAEGPIDTKADQLNYDRKTGWVVATGNVVITRGAARLTANFARLNIKTEDVHAFGNVVLTEGDSVWKGESLDYNFGEKTGSAAGISGRTEPFRIIKNDRVEKTGPNTFVLHNATVTTCTNEFHHCHYHVVARKVTVVPGDYLSVRRGVWYFAGVPVMYLPMWTKDLRDDFGWELRPGHSSRFGAFLLTAYRYRIDPTFTGRTHLDYRSERGIGVGQDFGWSSLTRGTGDLALYYADDDKPIADDENAATSDVEPERYRVRLRHYVGLSPRDYVMARANYLSDTDVLVDFFEDEYRLNPVPENYVTYSHRGDLYTANLVVRSRLNDFFGGVNRLPEGSLESFRQQISASSFYYQGRTALGFLERTYPVSGNDTDYSAVRLDTVHTVYRPSKHFRFLNLVPRTGMRGTYYSQTRETQASTDVITVTQTNTVIGVNGTPTTVVSTGTQTNTTSVDVDAGSGFRSQFELGLEASFKAFRIWDGGGLYLPRRHIVEPYINYTYLSEPSLLPGEIYQFDSIDALDKEHFVKVGVRNKLQEKRGTFPYDVIDVDVYTRLRMETESGQDVVDNFFMDAEIRPVDWFMIDLDGEYDTAESRLKSFNTQLIFTPDDLWLAGVEHRYEVDVRNQLSGTLTLKPNRYWHFNTYGRYELDESRIEEQGGYIQRNFDCMSFRLNGRVLPSYARPDGTQQDTDYRVTLEFWLTSFPNIGVLGRQGR